MHKAHSIIKFATHWMHAHTPNSYHYKICYTDTQTSVSNDIFCSVSSHLFYCTHCRLGNNQHYPSIMVSKLPWPHLTSSIWMHWDHHPFYFLIVSLRSTIISPALAESHTPTNIFYSTPVKSPLSDPTKDTDRTPLGKQYYHLIFMSIITISLSPILIFCMMFTK